MLGEATTGPPRFAYDSKAAKRPSPLSAGLKAPNVPVSCVPSLATLTRSVRPDVACGSNTETTAVSVPVAPRASVTVSVTV